MTWTEEQINKIIGLETKEGHNIDVFKLYGVLHVGNTTKGLWTLIKKFHKYGEGRLSLSLADFEYCEDEDDVRLTFKDHLGERITAKLV
ncbi:unnamed protein product [marine sediment metagenome]|uniref:Uncharacterized protein n=1 Tax=marine sediment metagenome TaxID=412755 RepID=X1C2L5_9ZZZZ